MRLAFTSRGTKIAGSASILVSAKQANELTENPERAERSSRRRRSSGSIAIDVRSRVTTADYYRVIIVSTPMRQIFSNLAARGGHQLHCRNCRNIPSLVVACANSLETRISISRRLPASLTYRARTHRSCSLGFRDRALKFSARSPQCSTLTTKSSPRSPGTTRTSKTTIRISTAGACSTMMLRERCSS